MAPLRAAKHASMMTVLKSQVLAYWALVQSYVDLKKKDVRAFAVRVGSRFGPMDSVAATAVTGIIEFVVGFVLLVICILIALIILPLVNNQATALNSAANTSATQKSVIPLIGLILIVAVIVACLAFMVHGFKTVIQSIG